MKYFIVLLVLIICAGLKPVTVKTNASSLDISRNDSAGISKADSSDGVLNVKSFGAIGNGIADDFLPIMAACNACILYPTKCRSVRIPIGNFRTTQPIYLQNKGRFFSISIKGDYQAKCASDEYLSKITLDASAHFCIGVQLGRSVTIENLALYGKFTFPSSVTYKNIGALRFSDWVQNGISDSRNDPYAGISIDPYSNKSGSVGGTSGMEIRQCAIKNFMVGIVLSPNGVTQNAEMINIIDDDIELVRVAIAICQDQSKEIHIDRLKCWGSTHTILDGLHYGKGIGGGSVMMKGGNIAGCVNQMFNITTTRFPFSAQNIYAESLYRIGSISGNAGANIDYSLFDLISGTGIPAPDYIFSGGPVTFRGGAIRYYDNDYQHRLNFVQNTSGKITFRDMTLNNYPLVCGLYGLPRNAYSVPAFDNVTLFYTQLRKDTLIKIPQIKITYTNWTATFDAVGINYKVGDYIMGSGVSSTTYYDPGMNSHHCPTVQIGRVTAVNGSTVYLDNVGLNAPGSSHDDFYISRLK